MIIQVRPSGAATRLLWVYFDDLPRKQASFTHQNQQVDALEAKAKTSL
jgi:hypothetical protein